MRFLFSTIVGILFLRNIQSSSSNLIDIIGGKPVNDNEDFSYQVSIHVINGQVFCGGVIIDERHILTAAHCICTTGYLLCPVPAQAIYVLAGSKSLSNPPSSSVLARVETVFVHNEYVEFTLANDIAILRLEQPLVFSNRIKSIPLAENTPADGTECLTSGFGVTIEGDVPSNNLLQATTTIISHDECSRYYRIYFAHICAKGHGAEICNGDSGGPLKCNGKLAGIISYSTCGQNNFPAGYTDVAKYRGWIDEQLKRTTSNVVQFSSIRSAISFILSLMYTIVRSISRGFSDTRHNILGLLRQIFPIFF